MIYFVLGMVSVLFEINSILPKDELIKTSYFVYSPPSDMSCMNALLKQWYSILILFLINKIFLNQGHALNFKNYLKFTWACTSKISLLGNSGKRFNRLISGLFCWLCLINLALIIIINPSLLNPGPSSPKSKDLTVAYQNVTGLIPFKELGQILL